MAQNRLDLDQLRQQAIADKNGWQRYNNYSLVVMFVISLATILYVISLPMNVELSTLQKVMLIVLVGSTIVFAVVVGFLVNPLSPFNPLRARVKQWKRSQQNPFASDHSVLKLEYATVLQQLGKVSRWTSYTVGTQLNAQKLLNAERYDEAISEYRRIAAMAWRDGQGHLVVQTFGQLAVALMAAERYMEARPFLEIALSITPSEGSLWGNLALTHTELKDFSDYVVKLLDTTIELFGKPKGSVMTNALLMSTARVMAEMKRSAEAEALYREAMTFTKPPSSADKGISLFVGGHVRLALGDTAGAIDNFKQAIALHPNEKFVQRIQKTLNELESH